MRCYSIPKSYEEIVTPLGVIKVVGDKKAKRNWQIPLISACISWEVRIAGEVGGVRLER